jgi:hypothetical protein
MEVTMIFGTYSRFLLGQREISLFNCGWARDSEPAFVHIYNHKLVQRFSGEVDPGSLQCFLSTQASIEERVYRHDFRVPQHTHFVYWLYSLLPILQSPDTVGFVDLKTINNFEMQTNGAQAKFRGDLTVLNKSTPTGTNKTWLWTDKIDPGTNRLGKLFHKIPGYLTDCEKPELRITDPLPLYWWIEQISCTPFFFSTHAEPTFQKTFKKLFPKNFQKTFKDFKCAWETFGNYESYFEYLKYNPVWQVNNGS